MGDAADSVAAVLSLPPHATSTQQPAGSVVLIVSFQWKVNL